MSTPALLTAVAADSAGSERVSAFARLRTLPALFRGNQLTLKFQWSSRTASQYLYTWGKAGMVEPLGGHTDVYANLVVAPSPNWEEALMMARPKGVMTGLEVLRRAGWITQIPHRAAVALPGTRAGFVCRHFELTPRPPGWFERVKLAVDTGGAPFVGLRRQAVPMLQPGWALADLLKTQTWGACGLQPDDVDWPAISGAHALSILQACKALGVDTALVLPWLQANNP